MNELSVGLLGDCVNIQLHLLMILTWIRCWGCKIHFRLEGPELLLHVVYMHSHVSYVHALAQVGFMNMMAEGFPQWPVSAPSYEPCPLLSLTPGTGFFD